MGAIGGTGRKGRMGRTGGTGRIGGMVCYDRRVGIKVAGWAVVTVAIVATIGCDRATKRAATTMLSGKPDHSYLADTVRLAYVENSGGFLSLGASWPSAIRTTFFTVATGVILLTLAVVAVRRRRDKWCGLGFALFLAGGASNWVDRVAHGSVVDFLNIGVGPVRTGVFNIADVAIMLGAVIFVVAEFRRNRPRKLSSSTGDRPA
jgi:signal peptidase II